MAEGGREATERERHLAGGVGGGRFGGGRLVGVAKWERVLEVNRRSRGWGSGWFTWTWFTQLCHKGFFIGFSMCVEWTPPVGGSN